MKAQSRELTFNSQTLRRNALQHNTLFFLT